MLKIYLLVKISYWMLRFVFEIWLLRFVLGLVCILLYKNFKFK